MRLKLLLGLSFLSLFTMSCEQEELLEPKTVAPIQTAVSNAAYITSFDANRKNLIAEERFESKLSSIFGKQNYTKHAYTESNIKARSGSKAARFELRKGDPGVRSEIWRGSETGQTRWYGMSLYLPSENWGTDTKESGWEILTQLHGEDDPGEFEAKRTPPIALSVIKGQLKLAVCWATAAYNTNLTRSGKKTFELGPIEKNKWLDLVYHIKFSYKSDGIIEMWKNGVKVIDYRGPNCYNDKRYPRLHLGVYKRNWTGVTKRVTYVDDIRVGDENATYNDVAPKASTSTDTPPPVDEKPTPTQPLSLTLMNADTQQPIQELTDGTILDLAKLPTRNLNILAISNKKIGSVGFNLTGAQTNTSTQTAAPYSLFGDTGGKVLPWAFTAGNYALTATSYSGVNGTGTAGPPLTVNFQVIDQVIPPVENVPPIATFVINNDAVSSKSTTVTLNITSAGATQMRFYDDNDNDVWGSWEPIATTKNWTLSDGAGPKWIKVQVRNAAGQESEEWFDTIILE